MKSPTAFLAFTLALGGAGMTAACTSTSGGGSTVDASPGNGEAAAPDASAGGDVAEGGPKGCEASAMFPSCSGGSECEPGSSCVYEDDAGGCGSCACSGSGDVGRFLCAAGKNGCPSVAPAAGSACLVENWSCFLPDDAGCTSLCGCLGSPVPGSAGVWSCNGCGGADASSD